MKKYIWLTWFTVTLVIAGFYGYTIFISNEKEALLIGDVTHGHFQIELVCDACHTSAFGGEEVLQNACVSCHQDELDEANDSHPKKKFNDPRNFDRLEVVDARYCVSCHTEHNKEQTHSMGVTLPDDFCYHCHIDIVKERESHKELAFDSCASAGCHNYHDNRALYERFLVDNANGAWLKQMTKVAEKNNAKHNAKPSKAHHSLEFKEYAEQHKDIYEQWQLSKHSHADVNCGACHSNEVEVWIAKPGEQQCTSCHKLESETFKQGKHGLRLSQGLQAFDPKMSSMSFLDGAAAHNGCNSCHQPHSFDVTYASTEACLTCHNDQHSMAFKDSPHAKALKNNNNLQAGQVTCATCHMPRLARNKDGMDFVYVNHNQNHNLRPNEKMIKPVCMQCHSLEFSLDALADKALIENNFSGKPSEHVPSIDWAKKRGQK